MPPLPPGTGQRKKIEKVVGRFDQTFTAPGNQRQIDGLVGRANRPTPSVSAFSGGNRGGKVNDARGLGARRWPSIGWQVGTGSILVVGSVCGAECRARNSTTTVGPVARANRPPRT